ncbi:MAG: VCBS repeat-containing protein [Phycisphaeraceae bacterium]|nr:VCBS repeat-containing protein [Phycisphaeraceae bacterium]
MSTLTNTGCLRWATVYGAIMGLLLAVNAQGQLFPPGQPIPVADEYGQIGGGGDYTMSLMGVADVFGNGPYDLFDNNGFIYPFIDFADNGAPRYGEPVPFTRDRGVNGTVFTAPDGSIMIISAAGKKVRLFKFDKAAKQFTMVAESPEITLPADISGPLGHIDDQGKVHVFYKNPDGKPYHRGDVHHHSHDYVPYNGAGFWTGGIHRDFLCYLRFADTSLKNAEQVKRYSNQQGEFLFSLGSLSIVNLGPGHETDLLSSEKLCVMRLFGWDGQGADLAQQKFVNDQNNVALRHPVIGPKAFAITDPDTGLSNLIVADTGRLWFYQYTGSFNEAGCPVFDGTAHPVMRRNAPLALGDLPPISAGDVDGDGLIDLIAGNDAGQLLFVKNVGSATQPAFTNPTYPLCGGKILAIQPGYRGSLQGPGEAMWGYTCPMLYDWNGDGRLDVLLNSALSEIKVLLQEQAGPDGPVFTEPRQMYCDGLALNLCWRSQVAVTTWGKEGGPICMIGLDEQNMLRCYWRIDDQNVERGDLLRLTTGGPICANDEGAGQTGRAKLVATDWDDDGDIDLMIGTSRGLSFPASATKALPDAYGAERAASVLVMRNMGSNEKPVFEYARLVQFNGERIRLATHSCSPQLVDLGRGKRDLLVSEEHGGVMYYPIESVSLAPLMGD